MAGPEIKQVQEAADAFKDNKINQVEANKIAEAIDPAKTKPADIQEFLKDSKTYPAFLDTIINNIDNYTKNDEINVGYSLSPDKKLQIEDNRIPLKQLSKEEKDKIMNDAKNFLLRVKDEKRKLSNTNTQPTTTLEKKDETKKGEDKTAENDLIKTDKILTERIKYLEPTSIEVIVKEGIIKIINQLNESQKNMFNNFDINKNQLINELKNSVIITKNKIPVITKENYQTPEIINSANEYMQDFFHQTNNILGKYMVRENESSNKGAIKNNSILRKELGYKSILGIFLIDKGTDEVIPYDAEKPLESMLLAINENFKQANIEDKKLIQTPEQVQANAEKIRNNLKDGIMKQVEVELKSLLKIKDKKLDNDYDNKKEAIYKFLYESFANELNTGKRIDNLVVGGLYVTINGIKQKMDAPNKENMKDFNLVGANILSNVKDINALLSANGNVMDNLFKNSQDKIVKKIKNTFPREAITKMTEQELNTELGNIKQKGFYINLGAATNPVTEVFSKDITIDTELAAIQFIESNNGLPKTTKEQIGGEGGADVQKDLTKKLKEILGEVPTNTYEKEAFKTELIQNKFSGWSKSILEAIYNFAQKLGLGDLLGMFNKDGLFDKVLLSKSRNDAMIARELYDKTKSKDTQLAEVKIKNFTTKISHTTIVETLNNCKKFISPVMSSNGKEADDKKRSELFMKGDSYDPTLVKAQFDGYVKLLGEKWENTISRVVEKDKMKTEKIYSYKDLITSDADLVEHFMQYVQTGQMPDGYSDKTIYENMKDLGKVPEVKKDPDSKTSEQAPATSKESTVVIPAKIETPLVDKPREKAANDFATSVKGTAFKSELWTDAYAVRFTVNGKNVVRMFKSPTSKRISK